MRPITIRGKQVPLTLLAMILMITGAGAAAGVTFEGNVQGEAISKVDQAIVAQSVDSPDDETNNDLGKVSDDGTKFRFAANVNQGDLYHTYVILQNLGNQDLNGVLTLNVPAPLEVEVATDRTSNANLGIARTSISTWNFNIEASEEVDEQPSNNVGSYITDEPVADRDGDGDVDADDITFSQTGGANTEGIDRVEVNADGTVTIYPNNQDDGDFESSDTFTYETASRIDILVAIPDDAQPGFYTIEGDVRPAEV